MPGAHAREGATNDLPERSSPPLLAYNVGVIGNRPNKLPDEIAPAVEAIVDEVLQHVSAVIAAIHKQDVDAATNGAAFRCYSPAAPELRVLTSLAEGADRIGARRGCALDFKLHCVLPASRQEYGADFKEAASRADYENLLHEAENVFELAGRRDGEWLEPVAYERAGRLTIAHSDMLLAIWNGEGGETGGTGQMVREAQHTTMPVLVIHTAGTVHVELSVRGVSTQNWREELRLAIEESLRPASTAPHGLRRFLGTAAIGLGSTSIAHQQEFADEVAGRAAKAYRRTYKVLYFFAPLAVIFAVSGLLLSGHEVTWIPNWFCTTAELLCIFTILSLTFLARYRHWHERWLDARVIAELLRTWAFLAPLGQSPSIGRQPPYVSPNVVNRDWTGWYLRARIREHGLCSGRMSHDFYAHYRTMLAKAIAGQIEHHRKKGHTRRRVHEICEVASLALFAGTAIACATHLLMEATAHEEGPGLLLIALATATACFPAIGSALGGLQAQGEYQRLAERAEGMQVRLEHLHHRLATIPGAHAPLEYTDLVRIAHEVSAIMLDELSDWRNLVRIRVLHPV